MSECFCYSLSGLRVESDFAIPELPTLEGMQKSLAFDVVASVCIRIAAVPENLENPVNSGVLYQAAPGQFLLRVPGVARYLARGGDEILVQPEAESLPAEVNLFLLGSVWAALLHQRGVLALHASGIVTPAGALVFMGRSSWGKSTLAAAFYRRGCPVLGDDIVAVSPQLEALPGFPQLRLWPDMLSALAIPWDETGEVRPRLPKRSLDATRGFSLAPQPIRAIYLLSSHLEPEFKLEKLQGMTRFSSLLHNTFRERFLGGLGTRPTHFQQVSRLAQQVPVNILTRPENPPNLERMVELVMNDLGLC